MLRVGLTGGIASGKTTVSNRLRELGAVVVDADVLAREVVEPGTSALAAVVDRFGESVAPNGVLDRAALGRIVFADPAARQDLERIVHPAVRTRAGQIEAAAGSDAVVVHVIPLLVETGQEDGFDTVVVVDLDPGTQRRRLQQRTGLTAQEVEARIAAQASPEQRLRVADEVLDNSGTPSELLRQVDALWARWTGSAGA